MQKLNLMVNKFVIKINKSKTYYIEYLLCVYIVQIIHFSYEKMVFNGVYRHYKLFGNSSKITTGL